MPVREPAVAGQFYPDDSEECRAEAEHYVSISGLPIAGEAGMSRAIGGIVPHAGWVCSGAVAAEVIRSLAADPSVETFVVFGAVHRPRGSVASVFTSGSWRTPLGEIAIDEQLARAVARASPLIEEDSAAHEPEHSIEVEVPFIQLLAPSVKLLPVMVPPVASAHEIGRVVAEQAAVLGRRVVFVASTDLTHYGPRYHFAPIGVGLEGIRWAKEVNDERMLGLVLGMKAEQVVDEARAHHNACGSGAVAAMIAASRHAGANAARLLQHTNSYEVLRSRLGEMDDAVGYAGVLLGVIADCGLRIAE